MLNKFPIVKFTSRIITSDDLQFSLDGKIEPRLVNLGTSNVIINGVLLEPQEGFNAGFTGAISKGSLNISFSKNEENQINKVVCFFGVKVEENTSC